VEVDVGDDGELDDDNAGKGAEKEKVAAVGGLRVESAESDMAETGQRLELD
jgi:hypothetical protein